MSEWISVGNRLPETFGMYLVFVEWFQGAKIIDKRLRSTAGIAWYSTWKREEKWDYTGRIPWKRKAIVTHWMPLPNPPN